jgi:hypothetical protein
MLEDPRKDGKLKNTLSFKGTGLKLQPFYIVTNLMKALLGNSSVNMFQLTRIQQ